MESNRRLALPAGLRPRTRHAADHAADDVVDTATSEGSYRAPAIPADQPNGDDQVFAAAELVRLGFATRVTLVNATVDEALPEAWEIKGTPVGLVRLAASRSRLTAGPR